MFAGGATVVKVDMFISSISDISELTMVIIPTYICPVMTFAFVLDSNRT